MRGFEPPASRPPDVIPGSRWSRQRAKNDGNTGLTYYFFLNLSRQFLILHGNCMEIKNLNHENRKYFKMYRK